MYLPQEEILCDLAGSKGPKAKDGKSLPPSLYIGHFMKPYFKDRVTGVVSGGGPALIEEVGGGQQAVWKERSSPQLWVLGNPGTVQNDALHSP